MKTLTRQCISLAILVFWGWSLCWAGETPDGVAGYKVSDLTFRKLDQALVLTVHGNGIPTFTTYQLFDPLRVVLDIANASLADGLALPIAVNQTPVARITGRILTDKKPFIAKLEIMLTEDWTYHVERQGNNIVVKFQGGLSATQQSVAISPQGVMSVIKGVEVNKTGDGLDVLIVADQEITKFTKVNLAKGHGRPDRFYIDIPEISAPGLALIKEVGIGALARIRMAKRQNGMRIVFDSALDGMFVYNVTTVKDGLLIAIQQPSLAVNLPSKAEANRPEPDALGGLLVKLANEQKVVAEQPEPMDKEAGVRQEETAVVPTKSPVTGTLQAQLKNVGITGDAFVDAGYDKQKISVDFYKIDLHNVFRLMGEISGYNMIVDDTVRGSLTLSLNNVPWDFVLDVIMNLKNLQREERFNTIVISLKSQNFTWPETKTAALEMEAPSDQLQVKIDQQLSQPPEAMEANLIVQGADVLARAGKMKEAMQKYEAAFDKWPQNADLAKQIANICLVNLGYNQKAVDYAKKSMALNPQDREAALQVAVGLANMQQSSALRYFELSVSGERPTRGALASYASYLENQADLGKGMAVLKRYVKLYGSDLDVMIAKARIYDKLKQPNRAVAEYKAILYSGYGLDQDLARYIKGRIAAGVKKKWSEK